MTKTGAHRSHAGEPSQKGGDAWRSAMFGPVSRALRLPPAKLAVSQEISGNGFCGWLRKPSTTPEETLQGCERIWSMHGRNYVLWLL